jgi:hypothetical protein
MQIDESEKQFRNALRPISESFETDANITVERDSHWQKQEAVSWAREVGIKTDDRDRQDEKTSPSITESREPRSKWTVERDSHPRKQEVESRLTEAGIKIDESDGHDEKAPLSISESRESGSNATVERNRHRMKQSLPMVSIEEGTQVRTIPSFCVTALPFDRNPRTAIEKPSTEITFRGNSRVIAHERLHQSLFGWDWTL